MAKEAVYDSVEARRDRLSTVAREIWEHPEVAFEETRSSAKLQAVLREEGFEVEVGVGGLETGFVARYGDEGPVVGTMGEFDALPGMSQRAAAEREPREEGAPGHGCGHNLFGAGSLGAALAVRDAIERGDVSGSVVYYGTPAEEDGGGKVYMVRAGAFEETDAVVSWHPGWYNTPTKGSCLAVDAVEYVFEGTTSHAAASPESGRSALDAVQLMNTGVEYLREHVVDSARIHYVITDGGDAPNVVPDRAAVRYYVRAPRREQVEAIVDRIDDVAEGAALMTGTEAVIDWESGMYGVKPNERLGDAIRENMEALGGFRLTDEQAELASELRESLGDVSGALEELPDEHRAAAADEVLYTEPVPATDAGEVGSYSTDDGDVSQVVPLGRMRTATWPVGTPAHSWQAVAASGSFGTEGMLYASKVIGATLYDLLADDDLRAAAREEFERRGGADGYDSPLPADAEPPTPAE